MYIRFDKELKKRTKNICKIIREILDVDDVDLVLITEEGKTELCFGTPVDDTYVALNLPTDDVNLNTLLDKFLSNRKAVWMDRNIEMSREEVDDALLGLATEHFRV